MRKLSIVLVLVVLLAALWRLQSAIEREYIYPFPPLATMRYVNDNPYLEMGGLFLGLRCAAADVVWIKTLQYYGGPSEGEPDIAASDEEYSHDEEIKAYSQLYPLCERAVWLDPYFIHVYDIGSASIGFVQERYDEAATLLRSGIVWEYNPSDVHYWRLNYSLAALGYDKIKDYGHVISMLQNIVDYEESPVILLRVLANTYEKNRQYRQALYLWQVIQRRFPDEESQSRARIKLSSLAMKIGH
jgi:tetratricopeptide (TPR) repeat protein